MGENRLPPPECGGRHRYGRLPGVPVLLCPSLTGAVGHHAEAGAGGGLLGLFTRRSGAGGNGRLPDYRHLSGGGPLLGRGGYFLPAVQTFGVLDLADPAWWNPAYCMCAWNHRSAGLGVPAQVWRRWRRKTSGSLPPGSAAFCMIVTVMTCWACWGLIRWQDGKGRSFHVPVYMAAYALLASLALAVLAAACLRKLDGGKGIMPWPRSGRRC